MKFFLLILVMTSLPLLAKGNSTRDIQSTNEIEKEAPTYRERTQQRMEDDGTVRTKRTTTTRKTESDMPIKKTKTTSKTIWNADD